jgi:TPR repeat protein
VPPVTTTAAGINTPERIAIAALTSVEDNEATQVNQLAATAQVAAFSARINLPRPTAPSSPAADRPSPMAQALATALVENKPPPSSGPAEALNTSPAVAQTTAALATGSETSTPVDTSVPVQQPSPQPTEKGMVLADDQIALLIKRGKDFIKSGDFVSARLLLQRATDAQSAEAALALGSTYDPSVIERLGVMAVRPDIELARKWYQRAAELGSASASPQLANLARTH